MSRVLVVLGIVVVSIAIALVAVMLLWGWIVPDVFSGAVKAGILPESLTFLQAFKLSVLIGVLFGSSKGSKS